MDNSAEIHERGKGASAQRDWLAGLLGLLVPGAGLLWRGDIATGLLAAWATGHCAALAVCNLAAAASAVDIPDAVTAAALAALRRGIVTPQAGLLAVLAAAIALGSAWSAWRGAPAGEGGDAAPAD